MRLGVRMSFRADRMVFTLSGVTAAAIVVILAFSAVPTMIVNSGGLTLDKHGGESPAYALTGVLISHAPISIGGNGEFTIDNGVTGGDGTPANPYIINGWEIDSDGEIGIAVRGTTAHFVIRDLNINSSNPSAMPIGIYFNGVMNATIENVTCINTLYGVQVQSSGFLSFINNSCFGNALGIYLDGCHDSTIWGNALCHNSGGGLSVYASTNTSIYRNNCSWNPASCGIWCDSRGQTTVENNTCIGNSVGIQVLGPTVCRVANNVCTLNVDMGMELAGADDALVAWNAYDANGYECGLAVMQSDRVIVKNNTFTNESQGVNLDSSTSCSVENNTFAHDQCDIGVYFRGQNTISNNTLRNGLGYGIILQFADGNSIVHNLVSNEAGFGVCMYESCSYNRIWANTFCGNRGSGVTFDPLKAQACDNGTNNYWNSSGSPHGSGNYWSDWTTPDSNHDGVVDSPYLLNGTAGAQDFYPLTTPTISDTEPPVTEASVSGKLGSNGYYVSNATLFLNATDDASGVSVIRWKVDAGAWSNYTEPINLSGGAWEIYYCSVDKSGNEEQVKSLLIKVDPIAPSTTANIQGTMGTNGWYLSAVSLSFTANLPQGCVLNSTYTRIGSNPFWNVNATLRLAEDGVTTVDYYSDDMAGNVEPVKSLSLKIDMTAPTLTISMANGTVIDTRSTVVAWTSTDDTSGIDRFEVYLDWAMVSAPNTTQAWVQLNELTDGSHYLEVRAVDRAGNVASVDVQFIVSATPPQVTITSPADGSFVSGPIHLTWEVLLSTGAFLVRTEIRIDSLPWQTVGGSQCDVSLDDGRHTIRVRVIDTNGNQVAESISVTEDSTPPALTILSPIPGHFTRDRTISWQSSDNVGIASTLLTMDSDQSINVSGRTSYLTDLSDGPHSIRITVVDLATNQVTLYDNFSIDTTVPTVTVLLPRQGSTVRGGDVIVSWRAYDEWGLSDNQLNVDGTGYGDYGNYENNTYHLKLGTGLHTIMVRVIDSGGNQVVELITFRVDNGAVSFSGPYYGLPTIAIIGVVLVVLYESYISLRKRRSRAPPAG